MENRLKKEYFILLAPVALLFAALFLAREFNLVRPGQLTLGQPWHSIMFITAAAAGIAGPVLIRTLFAHRVRSVRQVRKKEFLAFQKRLIRVTALTPYLALGAMAFDLPKFYASAIILMTLYALYFHFPSARRIAFDRRIFRVAK